MCVAQAFISQQFGFATRVVVEIKQTSERISFHEFHVLLDLNLFPVITMAGSIGTNAGGLIGFPVAGGAPFAPGPLASQQQPDQQRTQWINAQL